MMTETPKTSMHDPAVGSMRTATGRSAVTMVASQGFQFVLTVIGGMTMARLLSPEDFGIAAMAMAVILLASMVREFGVPHAVVQSPTMDDNQLTQLFWWSAKWNAVVFTAVLGSIPVVTWIFGETRIVPMIAALAACVFASGLTSVSLGLLRRKLRFGVIAVADSTSVFLSLGIAILSARLGAGPWALAIQVCVMMLAQGIFVSIGARWVPGLRLNASAPTDETLRKFSRHITFSKFPNYVVMDIHKFVVGPLHGAEALGLFSNAMRWSMLPVRQLQIPLLGVTVATLSRFTDDPERYRRYFEHFAFGLMILLLPGLTFAYLDADALILTLLGDQWSETVPLFRVLLISAAAMAILRMSKWAYFAEGRSNAYLTWTLSSLPVTVAAVLIGSAWGPIGVAWGTTISAGLLAPAGIFWCVRGSPLLSAMDMLRGSCLPAAAAAAGGGVHSAWTYFVHIDLPIVLQTMCNAGAFGIGTAGLVLLWPGGRRTIMDVLLTLRSSRQSDAPAFPTNSTKETSRARA